jgi:heme exporter protein B
MMMKQIQVLLQKEIRAEWRQKYAINGILLQVIAMIFVVFLTLKIVNAPTWNAVFWILLLFSSVNAIAKSFIAESKGSHLYHFGLVLPRVMLIARLVYNALLMCVIITMTLLIYWLLMGQYAQHLWTYLLCVVMGGIGFSSVYTMISAISSKANNSHTMMTILSLPLLIPMIMVASKAGKKAVDGLDFSLIIPDLAVLFCLIVLVVILALLLFPFLWRD